MSHSGSPRFTSTSDVAVALLFDAFVSVVVVVMLAVLEMVVPDAALASTCTTRLNVALAPAASVPIVATNVPLPPAGGVVSVNVGPEFWVADTNVVLGGITSDRPTV